MSAFTAMFPFSTPKIFIILYSLSPPVALWPKYHGRRIAKLIFEKYYYY